jgi:hypothetical protein
MVKRLAHVKVVRADKALLLAAHYLGGEMGLDVFVQQELGHAGPEITILANPQDLVK